MKKILLGMLLVGLVATGCNQSGGVKTDTSTSADVKNFTKISSADSTDSAYDVYAGSATVSGEFTGLNEGPYLGTDIPGSQLCFSVSSSDVNNNLPFHSKAFCIDNSQEVLKMLNLESIFANNKVCSFKLKSLITVDKYSFFAVVDEMGGATDSAHIMSVQQLGTATLMACTLEQIQIMKKNGAIK